MSWIPSPSLRAWFPCHITFGAVSIGGGADAGICMFLVVLVAVSGVLAAFRRAVMLPTNPALIGISVNMDMFLRPAMRRCPRLSIGRASAPCVLCVRPSSLVQFLMANCTTPVWKLAD